MQEDRNARCFSPTCAVGGWLLKKVGGKIETNEYIDFGELPPAKGKGTIQAFEGQVVVVQAADLV